VTSLRFGTIVGKSGRPERQPDRAGQAGFSLVEVLVAVAILGVIMIMVYSFQAYAIAQWRRGDVRTELRQNVRVTLARIATEMRQAQTVTLRASNEVQFLNFAGQTIRFYLSGNTVKRTVNGAAEQDVGLKIQSLTFSYATGNKLVTLAAASVTEESFSFAVWTKVFLRNGP
jgi:prepilin-type N-terminal cleavage/methylation domain-containing protein